MSEGIINKIKRILRFYVGQLFGKKYGCCSKIFISCKKCLNVKNLATYEQERLREMYREIKCEDMRCEE